MDTDLLLDGIGRYFSISRMVPNRGPDCQCARPMDEAKPRSMNSEPSARFGPHARQKKRVCDSHAAYEHVFHCRSLKTSDAKSEVATTRPHMAARGYLCDDRVASRVLPLSEVRQESFPRQQNSASCVARDLCTPVVLQNRATSDTDCSIVASSEVAFV